MIEFQTLIFALSFFISQLISIKFPGIKFYLIIKNKKLRIHHTFTAGLLALITSFSGHSFWFNVSLGGMFQDILYHSWKVLRKNLKS